MNESPKWGVIKHYDPRLFASTYVTVSNQAAHFTPERRRVVTDLSYAEADALCTILNAGEEHE